jgi:ribosomal protein L11 methyltransferase
MTGRLVELSFDLGSMEPETAEAACFECGAGSVTFVDAQDNPVLEPLPGEFRLWPTTRLKALFADVANPEEVALRLAGHLGVEPALIRIQPVADRVWEREWLRDFHAMRFGRRLWICPRHERVSEPEAVVVHMDPGLAFGTGTHPTTALCLEWLDANLQPGSCVIDYGCGSGVLAVAAAKLGAREVHCFDIDRQALLATRDNAQANALKNIRIHESMDTLPHDADGLLSNILSGPLCELATRFASLVRPRGFIVLAGLLQQEESEVTRAYGACFDMGCFGQREGWLGLSGRRRSCTPSAPSAP